MISRKYDCILCSTLKGMSFLQIWAHKTAGTRKYFCRTKILKKRTYFRIRFFQSNSRSKSRNKFSIFAFYRIFVLKLIFIISMLPHVLVSYTLNPTRFWHLPKNPKRVQSKLPIVKIVNLDIMPNVAVLSLKCVSIVLILLNDALILEFGASSISTWPKITKYILWSHEMWEKLTSHLCVRFASTTWGLTSSSMAALKDLSPDWWTPWTTYQPPSHLPLNMCYKRGPG